MSTIAGLYARMIEAMDVAGLEIPAAYVRLYGAGDDIPPQLLKHAPRRESVMCCQALRHVEGGEPILLTIDNIGCVAAAITLGLVDAHRPEPLPGARVYTCMMKEQSGLGPDFRPPAPAQFTSGEVYACKDAGRAQFALFGPDDPGRFKDVATARAAVAEMAAIQPATTKAVFVFSNAYDELDIEPHVVVLSPRPAELTRLVQAWAFVTGGRVRADMGPLRAVDSDLIVRPHLSGQINVSSYCLGSRLLAGLPADRMGMGLPMACFRQVVEGMVASRRGYPFHAYPGCGPRPGA